MGEHETMVLNMHLFGLSPSRLRRLEDYGEKLEDFKKLLDNMGGDILSFVLEYSRSKIGYAIPMPDTLSYLLSFFEGKKVLEVGAGRGWFASLIQKFGNPTSYVATDVKGIQGKVVEMRHTMALETHGDAEVLVLLWPPYEDPMAFEALKAFKGDYVLYCGEGHSGCTADDGFHDLLEQEWKLIYEKDSFRFPERCFGLNDTFSLFRRKTD
jgi:hypothetical protein